MILKHYFNKPEYFFQPHYLLKKLTSVFGKEAENETLTTLPWGTSFYIRPKENIGRAIFDMGVYDIALTEVVFRLVNEGDFCLDIGANIGYITNLMAICCKSKGKVYAFEPHPVILEQSLSRNISLLAKEGYENVVLFPFALSDHEGTGQLYIPDYFTQNPGTASLEKHETGHAIEITLKTLDEFLTPGMEIRLLKIDVEGHELSVFKGASEAVARKSIRNIVYEEHNIKESAVTAFLEERGYSIFRINKLFGGVLLTDKKEEKYVIPFEASNYLATLYPQEIEKRFEKQGWSFLKLKSR